MGLTEKLILSDFLKVDTWMAPAYGVGQMFSFIAWVAVALAILSQYGLDATQKAFMFATILGALGSYFYGLRSYQQKVKK